MDVACYHSIGVDTAMLYNDTTLNKALLLDWPVTLCVHSFVGLTAATEFSVLEFLLQCWNIVLVCIGPVMYVWEGVSSVLAWQITAFTN